MKIESIDKLIESISGYLETRLELVKLEIREEFVGLLIRTAMLTMILMLATFFVFFAGIGVAFWLNELLDSTYLGWLIVGGVFLLKIISIMLLKFTKSGNDFLQKIIEFLVTD